MQIGHQVPDEHRSINAQDGQCVLQHLSIPIHFDEGAGFQEPPRLHVQLNRVPKHADVA